jgi:hypothetical protein
MLAGTAFTGYRSVRPDGWPLACGPLVAGAIRPGPTAIELLAVAGGRIRPRARSAGLPVQVAAEPGRRTRPLRCPPGAQVIVGTVWQEASSATGPGTRAPPGVEMTGTLRRVTASRVRPDAGPPVGVVIRPPRVRQAAARHRTLIVRLITGRMRPDAPAPGALVCPGLPGRPRGKAV